MEHAESVAPAPFPERFSGNRVGTGAAWKGLAASLLLHACIGAAAIGALSGPADPPPLVIDLTLAEPAGEGPPTSTGSEEARVRPMDAPVAETRSDGPSSLALSARPASLPAATAPTDITGAEPVRSDGPISPDRPTVPAPENRPGTAVERNATVGAVSGSPTGAAATARAATGKYGGKEAAGNPNGKTGEGRPVGNFAYIRDAVQREIAYPATARKMGWEGKVVVAFRLLSDGSVRDVRVIRGSGHAALDRGAVAAVRIASPFPRPPVEAEIVTPVVYRLTPPP